MLKCALILWLAAGTLLGLACLALPPAAAQGAARPAKSAVLAVRSAAAGVAPSLAADAFLRLAQSGIPSPAERRRLRQDAFDLAGRSAYPVRRRMLLGNMDSGEGTLALAYRTLALDGLSLRAAAVRGELEENPARARQWLERMHLSDLAPLDCTSFTTYDLTAFYQLLEQVTRQGFTPGERATGLPTQLLQPYVSHLATHAQVRPAARLLAAVALSATERTDLVTRFAASLAQLRGDERSFAAVAEGESKDDAVGAVGELVAVLPAGAARLSLVSALRDYLAANLGGTVCSGIPHVSVPASDGRSVPLPRVAARFNQRFAAELRAARIAPIAADELRDARVAPDGEIHPFRASASEQSVLEAFGALNPVPPRPDATWQTRYDEVLLKLADWQFSPHDAAALFDQKAYTLMRMVELAPSPDRRDRALDQLIALLEADEYAQPERLERWWIERQLTGRLGDGGELLWREHFQRSHSRELQLAATLAAWHIK